MDNIQEPLNPREAVAEFHRAFKLPPVNSENCIEVLKLRKSLIFEEATETILEIELLIAKLESDKEVLFIDFSYLAKELADLEVVTLGTYEQLGIPGLEVFAEVHKSNMSKLDSDGNPIYRDDGKVLKGPNYKLADIVKVLSDYEEKEVRKHIDDQE